MLIHKCQKKQCKCFWFSYTKYTVCCWRSRKSAARWALPNTNKRKITTAYFFTALHTRNNRNHTSVHRSQKISLKTCLYVTLISITFLFCSYFFAGLDTFFNSLFVREVEEKWAVLSQIGRSGGKWRQAEHCNIQVHMHLLLVCIFEELRVLHVPHQRGIRGCWPWTINLLTITAYYFFLRGKPIK